MTFSQLKECTAALLEIPTSDTEAMTLIGNAVNNAYLTIARDKWRPVTSEKAQFFNLRYPIELLSENFVALKSVSDSAGRKVDAWAGKDFIHVFCDADEMNIEYCFLPVPMHEDTDEPILPVSQVDPYAYIYFAASIYCSVKHQHTEASMWDTRYRNVVENIKETRSGFIMPKRRWR